MIEKWVAELERVLQVEDRVHRDVRQAGQGRRTGELGDLAVSVGGDDASLADQLVRAVRLLSPASPPLAQFALPSTQAATATKARRRSPVANFTMRSRFKRNIVTLANVVLITCSVARLDFPIRKVVRF